MGVIFRREVHKKDADFLVFQSHIIYFQVVLILANKQDLPNAMNIAEITDKLGLHCVRNKIWHIQARRSHIFKKGSLDLFHSGNQCYLR